MEYRIKGEDNAFRFNCLRLIETDNIVYILFKDSRYVNDFMIKFFMRDIYGTNIPNITITNEMISIEKNGTFFVEEVKI